MDLADWLRGLGLEQYEDAFRDNEIDWKVLPSLTADDLKEIGVVPVGHRRRLLDAIAALGQGEGPRETPPASASGEAERRQLTVMFCDLVGSTPLSARLDPEDLREVIGAYHRCCADLVSEAGGFVAKYMGDGVLAYFGYPLAHEHDAEHAVRAGLALVEAAPKLTTAAGVPLQVRVGIATGLVVVGDLIGAGAAQEQAVVGETPNLAARLQALAEPGAVVIADGTRRLLGNLFELKDLGTRDLKGIARPARAWAALRARSVGSRFDALHPTGLTALVGREEESELLLRRWSRAKTGEGQVALLSGEAGIGKSRLTAALLERLASEPHMRLRYFCSAQRADSAFHPIIGQMERAAGLAYDDKSQAKLDKLDALLAQTSTSPEDAALFAEMLSLPNDGRYPALELTPEQRRQRVLEALMSQLAGLARRQPVLMILEDAHWIDPTSLEVFGRIVDRIKTLPALLIVTFRPDFNAPWVGQSHVTSLMLNRLGEREAAAIIACLVGNQALPADVLAEIVERTDGIPLFVEEMTKAVLEAESEGAARHTVAAVPAPALAVPASLHASLMARLDRLGPAKEVAQIGSAIGREFSHALLHSVVRKPETELGSALDRLVQAGLLSRQGVPPQASYLFKHALVQDAAYGTLLREPRRALHARIAETLESRFAETAENQPEILAHHCTEAGQIEKAAGLWGKAGQQSLARSALVEAAVQLTRALDQIATLPGTAALRRERIKLQVALITPHIHVKGHAAAETKAAAEQARSLIEQAEALGEPSEDPLLLFSVLYAFCSANFVAFNGDVCRDLAAQFLALAKKQRATVPLMVGHCRMGMSLLATGDIAEGRGHFDTCRASSAGDAIWPRPCGGDLSLPVVGSVAAWLSRGCAQRRRRRAQECARDGSSRHADGRFILCRAAIYPLRQSRCPSRASPTACRSGRRQRFPVLEGVRNGEPRFRAGPDRQGFGRNRNADLRDGRHAHNGNDTFFAIPFAAFGPRPCGAWAIRGGLALHRRSDDSGGDNQRKVVRGGHPPNGRRNRADVARARRGESAGAFRASHRHRPRAAGKVLGIARGDEPGPAAARSRQAAAGARSSRPGLRLVHRGLRHRRSERGQGAARSVGLGSGKAVAFLQWRRPKNCHSRIT
jgi:class 3 adenylate cyclase